MLPPTRTHSTSTSHLPRLALKLAPSEAVLPGSQATWYRPSRTHSSNEHIAILILDLLAATEARISDPIMLNDADKLRGSQMSLRAAADLGARGVTLAAPRVVNVRDRVAPEMLCALSVSD